MKIRLATEDDAAAILAIYSPYVLDTAITFEYEPPSVEEMRTRIATTLERHPWLVCERAEELAGYAYAGPHRKREAYQWVVETSVYVGQDHHRQGVARALYTSLLALLKLQGFTQALAGVALPNNASVLFHQSFGFESFALYKGVGHKHGQWYDTEWSKLDLNPTSSEQQAPLTPAQLCGTQSWELAMKPSL